MLDQPKSMNTKPLTIIAIVTAKPGREGELRTAQEQLVADTLQESGCLYYELHQSREDGRILVFVESWETEKQWRDHMEGEAMQRFRATGASDLIEDFSLLQLDPVAGGRGSAAA